MLGWYIGWPLVSTMVSTMVSNKISNVQILPLYHYTCQIKFQFFLLNIIPTWYKIFNTNLILDTRHSCSFFPLVSILKHPLVCILLKNMMAFSLAMFFFPASQWLRFFFNVHFLFCESLHCLPFNENVLQLPQPKFVYFNGWSCLWFCQKWIIYGSIIHTRVTIYIHAGIGVHKISVHIIANPFHIVNYILYHAIYIIFFSALIPWCIRYQNCGKPYIPVTGWYHKVVIPAQHWSWPNIDMSLGPRPILLCHYLLDGVAFLKNVATQTFQWFLDFLRLFYQFPFPHRNCINVLPWQLQRHCLFWYVLCLDDSLRARGNPRHASAQINMNVYVRTMYIVHTTSCVCVCVCVYEGLTLH